MDRLSVLEQSSFNGDLDALRTEARRRVFRSSFGLGLMGSIIGGAVTLLVLVLVHPERGNLRLPEALAAITPSWTAPMFVRPAAPVPPIAAAPVAGVTAAESAEAILDISLNRGSGVMTPLPLQVSGVRDPGAVTVWLRDMPESVWLSQGERTDEHTWSLRMADLRNLFVALNESVPDAFNIRIEVSTRDGASAARALARVQVHEVPEAAPLPDGIAPEIRDARPDGAKPRGDAPAAKTPAQRAETTVAMRLMEREDAATPPARSQRAKVAAASPVRMANELAARAVSERPVPSDADVAPAPAPALQPVRGVTDVPVRTMAEQPAPVRAGMDALLPVLAAPSQRRLQRPEGMSALGAVTHEEPADGRLLWWKMPLPEWAPFGDTVGR